MTAITTADKKAATAAYKERKTTAGIYAVRCTASGQIWVGQAQNLETVQNRIWFSLRMSNNTHRELQKVWSVHGGDHFTFEVLERLEEEESPYIRDALLKERAAHWRSALAALAI
jgi:hypothetical protein